MGEVDATAVMYYNRERRRSSFTRPMRDPEEILEGLRSLKAVKGELSRTMSFSGDKRRGSREYKFSSFLSAIISLVRPSVCCLSLYLSIRSSHLSTRFFIFNATITTTTIIITIVILSLSLFFITVTYVV